MRPSVFIVLGLAIVPSAAAQVTLSAAATADNAFTAYISTDPLANGSSFLSGDSWPTTFTGSTSLPGGGTYYLHVLAQDFGPPAMFIGRFTLDGADATFQNGTQTLVTNTADWRVSNSAFGVGEVAPLDIGPNGSGPWGNFPLMGPDAHFLWHPNGGLTAYFSTTITVVPAPTGALALAGGAMLLTRRRRA